MKFNFQKLKDGQGMGITALALGAIGTFMPFIYGIGLISFLIGVLSIIIGAIGLSQAKRVDAPTVIPKAGLISGIVSIAFLMIWMLAIVGIYVVFGG